MTKNIITSLLMATISFLIGYYLLPSEFIILMAIVSVTFMVVTLGMPWAIHATFLLLIAPAASLFRYGIQTPSAPIDPYEAIIILAFLLIANIYFYHSAKKIEAMPDTQPFV